MGKVDTVATGYLYNRAEELLLVRHKKLGILVPPGGHQEDGESLFETVIREFEEEVGLTVEHRRNHVVTKFYERASRHGLVPRPFCVDLHDVGDHDHESHNYRLTFREPQEIVLNTRELSGYEWVDRYQLNRTDIPENVQAISDLAWEDQWRKSPSRFGPFIGSHDY